MASAKPLTPFGDYGEQHNLHYPELKAMPSEPSLDRENVSQTLMKPAIQLPLF